MPDITMCKGENCHLKETCWRYLEIPGVFQSYFGETPLNETTKKCDYYVEMNKSAK